MALSRGQLLYLIEHNGADDWKNISFISATTHYPIYFSEYNIVGQKGIDFVDIDLGSGEFLCGFLIYGLLPVGARTSDNERVEHYVDVSEIIRIGFKRDTAPSYVPTE